MMLVGSYSPGCDITGLLAYLKTHTQRERHTLSKQILATKALPMIKAASTHYLHIWYAMSGMFRASDSHSPENRNSKLNSICSPYSGRTS